MVFFKFSIYFRLVNFVGKLFKIVKEIQICLKFNGKYIHNFKSQIRKFKIDGQTCPKRFDERA